MIVWTAGIYDVIKSTFHVWVFARKPKKKKRKVKEDPMAKASGPSNAEQAHSMRNVFGFTSTPPATNGTTQAEPAQPTACTAGTAAASASTAGAAAACHAAAAASHIQIWICG